MRILLITLTVVSIFLSGCRKENPETETQVSTMTVEKNGDVWTETRAIGTLNTTDNMMSIMAQEGLETFTIRFKKPEFSKKLGSFSATALFTPAIYAASVSDFYDLDETKDNKIRVYIIDNLKKRIAGEFQVNLKRDERYGPHASNLYRGKFDVQFEEFDL